jgi:hypothetical protein
MCIAKERGRTTDVYCIKIDVDILYAEEMFPAEEIFSGEFK